MSPKLEMPLLLHLSRVVSPWVPWILPFADLSGLFFYTSSLILSLLDHSSSFAYRIIVVSPSELLTPGFSLL